MPCDENLEPVDFAALGCRSTATRDGTGAYVVQMFKGMVQLSGFARSQADIDKAVQVAGGIAGVKFVKNDMRIEWGGSSRHSLKLWRT